MTTYAAFDRTFDELLARRPYPTRPLSHHLIGAASILWVDTPKTATAFSVDRFPTWLIPTFDRLRELVSLQVGWDGHDGRPTDPSIAAFSIQFLLQTLEADSPTPQVVPLSYGGVQLEWHEQGIDLEIEVQAANRIFLSFEDHLAENYFEDSFSTDYTEAARLIRELTSRKQH